MILPLAALTLAAVVPAWATNSTADVCKSIANQVSSNSEVIYLCEYEVLGPARRMT